MKKEINPKWCSDKLTIGLLLWSIRLRHKFSRQDIAESINMSIRTVFAIESEHNASLDECLKLFTFYYKEKYATKEDEQQFIEALLKWKE